MSAEWKIDDNDTAFSGYTTISFYAEDDGTSFIFVVVPEEHLLQLYTMAGDDEPVLISSNMRYGYDDLRDELCVAACLHDMPQTSSLLRCFGQLGQPAARRAPAPR